MPTTLTPVTGDVLVSASASGSQVWPLTLPKPGGGYYVLYSSDKDGGPKIFLQEMTDAGVRVGGEIAVSPGYPAYAFQACVMADGNLAISWPLDDFSSYFEVVTPAGVVINSPKVFNIRPSSLDPAPGGGFVAAGLNFTKGVVAQFDAGGILQHSTILSGSISVAESLASGDLLAVTISSGVMTANYIDGVTGDVSGGLPVSASETAAGGVDVLQLANGNIVISWIDHTGGQPASLHYRVFDSAMTPISADITIADAVNPDRPSMIKLAGGGFLMSWAGDDGAGEGVLARVFNNAGVASSAIMPVTETTASGQYGAFSSIAVQLDNGDLAFTWWSWGSTNGDAYTRVLSLNAGPPGGIDGTPGNDTLHGTSGGDTINGLAGNDKLYGDDGNDTVNGGDGADYLYGGAGTDILDGGAGNDLMDGGTGADTMRGGQGNDIYYVDDRGDVVTENPNEGYDIVRSTLSWTLGDNLEGLQLLGSDNLNGTGNALANNIQGNSGANTLHGLDGNDTIDGGDGNDRIYGDDGGDILSGGAGLDILDGGEGADTLDGGDGADKLYGGNGNDSLTGGAGADLLDGGAGNDTLSGGDGNDTLDGGTGNDAMAGGAGNDVYYVDSKFDTAMEAANEGYDIVRSSVTWTLGTNFEALELQGSANLDGTGNAAANSLTGNSGNNTLSGLGGNDTINGGDGNDTIIGGAGNDVLSGGAGSDTFVVLQESVGGATLEIDQITDFSTAQGDKLDLSAIDADNGAAGDQAFTLVGSFSHHAGEMTLSFSGGITVLSLDVNGDGLADYQMKINGDVTHDSGGWIL
jgi:Ca2+-binding RTX toxin-like protein